jgi:outer membrane protein assembly factor BamE
MPRTAPSKPLTASLLVSLGLAALAGCSSLQSSDNFLGVITPYRIEIVQGNVVTKEQVAAVKPGMSRADVRDVLGSPLLTDIFHADRWDYVFTIKRPGTEPQHRRVVVLFEGDALKSIDAPNDLPGEREFVQSITTAKNAAKGKAPVLELTEEQRKALPPPRAPDTTAAPADAASAPSGPTRTYPPLEAAQ